MSHLQMTFITIVTIIGGIAKFLTVASGSACCLLYLLSPRLYNALRHRLFFLPPGLAEPVTAVVFCGDHIALGD
jgi:hypothetical protein